MIFYHVVHNTSPGAWQYVETTIAGFCIFSKFESRAKLFTEYEADELVLHLRTKNIKKHYAKVKAQNNEATINEAIRFTPPGNKASDNESDPGDRDKSVGRSD